MSRYINAGKIALEVGMKPRLANRGIVISRSGSIRSSWTIESVTDADLGLRRRSAGERHSTNSSIPPKRAARLAALHNG